MLPVKTRLATFVLFRLANNASLLIILIIPTNGDIGAPTKKRTETLGFHVKYHLFDTSDLSLMN